MSEKSHVGMEAKVCEVCCKEYETGGILLETRFDRSTGHLRQTLDRLTVTGWGLCPEHQKLYDEGYIALVEADGPVYREQLRREDAVRTGAVAHIRRSVWPRILNIPLPLDSNNKPLPMVFVQPGVVDKLKELMQTGENNGTENV